jgi:hypothetical protein
VQTLEILSRKFVILGPLKYLPIGGKQMNHNVQQWCFLEVYLTVINLIKAYHSGSSF